MKIIYLQNTQKMKIRFAFYFLVLSFLFSCGVSKDLNYMQDIEKYAQELADVVQDNTLQPGDELVITITAKDMDVVKPFNQNYSSGEMIQNVQITGNIPNRGQASSGPTYRVDSRGVIDFPVLGKIEVNGLSLLEFKEILYQKLTKYIKNPTVNVKLNNFKVSVMGEVARPGYYMLIDGKGTIMEALSMAGDLTIYGLREQVLLIRTIDGKVQTSKIDLTKSDFLHSSHYILKQGDVLYVPANRTKQKMSRLDPNASIYIAVAGILVTILTAILIKK